MHYFLPATPISITLNFPRDKVTRFHTYTYVHLPSGPESSVLMIIGQREIVSLKRQNSTNQILGEPTEDNPSPPEWRWDGYSASDGSKVGMKLDTDFELFYDLQLVSEDGLAGCSIPNGQQGDPTDCGQVGLCLNIYIRMSSRVGPISNNNVMVVPKLVECIGGCALERFYITHQKLGFGLHQSRI